MQNLLKQVPYCLSIVFIKIKEKGTALTVKYFIQNMPTPAFIKNNRGIANYCV